jgi:hypothetical protein
MYRLLVEFRKTVASGRNGAREAQLYEQYSEHRKVPVQRAAGFSTFLEEYYHKHAAHKASCDNDTL